MSALLSLDPAARPTAAEVLSHPFFADVPLLLRGSSTEAALRPLLPATSVHCAPATGDSLFPRSQSLRPVSPQAVNMAMPDSAHDDGVYAASTPTARPLSGTAQHTAAAPGMGCALTYTALGAGVETGALPQSHSGGGQAAELRSHVPLAAKAHNAAAASPKAVSPAELDTAGPVASPPGGSCTSDGGLRDPTPRQSVTPSVPAAAASQSLSGVLSNTHLEYSMASLLVAQSGLHSSVLSTMEQRKDGPAGQLPHVRPPPAILASLSQLFSSNASWSGVQVESVICGLLPFSCLGAHRPGSVKVLSPAASCRSRCRRRCATTATSVGAPWRPRPRTPTRPCGEPACPAS